MGKFEIRAIREEALPAIADFFVRWRKNRERDFVSQQAVSSVSHRNENSPYLRWLLVQNPARADGADLGYCVVNQNGLIVGTILTFPSYFVCCGKKLKGLCSGSFFVDAEAQTQGFFIFKRFLNTAGHDFFFGTTCSPNSAALWRKLRGLALSDSDSTFILPYQIDALLEAFAENRDFHPAGVALLRSAGRLANPLVKTVMRSSSSLQASPCRDWEKLAELARMHRNPESITNERSAKFLEWRYGQTLAGDQKEIYCFWDQSGNEGWFALGSGVTGRRKKIRVTELLDVVWPQGKVEPREIVAALVANSVSTSDALYMRPRIGLPLNGFSRLVLRSRYQSPQCYVMEANGNGNLEPARFDFVAADGDCWP